MLREGDPVLAGGDEGAEVANWFRPLTVGDGGEVMLQGTVREVDGSLTTFTLMEAGLGVRGVRVLARRFDALPEVGPEAEITSVGVPMTSGSGDAGFPGRLRVSPADETHFATFMTDPSGRLQAIGYRGLMLDVGDDPSNPDMRMVASSSMVIRQPRPESLVTGISDSGTALVQFFFDGGPRGRAVPGLVCRRVPV